MDSLKVYPIDLIGLERRLCVVLGGGHEALQKVRGLRRVGARVRVIAPEVLAGLRRLAEQGEIERVRRPYAYGDLAGAWLAIAADDTRQANAEIAREAEERGVLLNAVDDVPHCNFIAPSVLRRGDLVISISTSGKAPALAVRLRERLEEALGPEYATLLEELGKLRPLIAASLPEFEDRRRVWYAIVDGDLLEALARGGRQALRGEIEAVLTAHGIVPEVEWGEP